MLSRPCGEYIPEPWPVQIQWATLPKQCFWSLINLHEAMTYHALHETTVIACQSALPFVIFSMHLDACQHELLGDSLINVRVVKL